MSSKEDIAFRKLSMLMKAVTEANEQDDTLEELKAAAFEVCVSIPAVSKATGQRYSLSNMERKWWTHTAKTHRKPMRHWQTFGKVHTSTNAADWNTITRRGQKHLQQMQPYRCITI